MLIFQKPLRKRINVVVFSSNCEISSNLGRNFAWQYTALKNRRVADMKSKKRRKKSKQLKAVWEIDENISEEEMQRRIGQIFEVLLSEES